MLSEAIDVCRTLWNGGVHSWQGEHFVIDHARLYDLPDRPIPLVVGVSGPHSVALAAAKADGIMATEAKAELVDGYRTQARAKDGPRYAEAILAVAPSEEAGLELARRQFRFSALGWAVNSELPTVEGFEAASQFIRPSDMAELVSAGPDPEVHLAGIRKYLDAGFDRIVLTAPGPDQQAFISYFERELKPRLDRLGL